MVEMDQFSSLLGEGTLEKQDEPILGLVLSNHTTTAASSGPHEAKEEKGGRVSVFTPGGSSLTLSCCRLSSPGSQAYEEVFSSQNGPNRKSQSQRLSWDSSA